MSRTVLPNNKFWCFKIFLGKLIKWCPFTCYYKQRVPTILYSLPICHIIFVILKTKTKQFYIGGRLQEWEEGEEEAKENVVIIPLNRIQQ